MRSAALPRFSSKIPGFISYVILSVLPGKQSFIFEQAGVVKSHLLAQKCFFIAWVCIFSYVLFGSVLGLRSSKFGQGYAES